MGGPKRWGLESCRGPFSSPITTFRDLDLEVRSSMATPIEGVQNAGAPRTPRVRFRPRSRHFVIRASTASDVDVDEIDLDLRQIDLMNKFITMSSHISNILKDRSDMSDS